MSSVVDLWYRNSITLQKRLFVIYAWGRRREGDFLVARIPGVLGVAREHNLQELLSDIEFWHGF